MTTAPSAIVDGRGARRARRGHPWIYADDVLQLSAGPGELAAVFDRAGQFCCWAAASPASKIPLRRVSTRRDPPDDRFWSERLRRALGQRGARAAADQGCARLVHAEADGCPGLTVDRYGHHLVVQASTAWADRVQHQFARELLTATGCVSALARADVRARQLEGLPLTVEALIGTTPATLEVEAGGAQRLVDPYAGHKTGLYLDQQENHRRAPHGLSGRVLDLFCGEGGFSLPLALAGHGVTAVDQSRAGLERADAAAARCRPPVAIEWIEADVFDWLDDAVRRGARFDAVILDPPPFARKRAERDGGLRGYRDLHRRALRLLAPGGRLLSFSCSFHVDPASFEETLRDGAEEAAVSLRLIERLGPAPDHPELVELPESRYLKGLLVEVQER